MESILSQKTSRHVFNPINEAICDKDVLSLGQENEIVALVARGRMFMLSTVDELEERSRYKRVGFKRDYADYPL